MISMNSIILEGWKIHVESVADRKSRYELLLHQYENARLALIQPFSKSFFGIWIGFFWHIRSILLNIILSNCSGNRRVRICSQTSRKIPRFYDFSKNLRHHSRRRQIDVLPREIWKEGMASYFDRCWDIYCFFWMRRFDSRILLSSYFRGTFVKRNKANCWNNLDRIKSTNKHWVNFWSTIQRLRGCMLYFVVITNKQQKFYSV